jgi:hypothetical protein
MPGGLLQLVGVGAQNELVNGNPSMTHFRAVYRRHTNFAMEHIRMSFTTSNLELSTTGTRTISCRIDRYAQMIHDLYLVFTLPDIWSPLKYLGTSPVLPVGYAEGGNSIGYEFQWIKDIGYNLIDHVDITFNGQVIQRLQGEWLKFYSYLTHDKNKREIVDQMVGNVPELYDPGNAYDRTNQYPHAVTGLTSTLPSDASGNLLLPANPSSEPSIRSRQLIIPLHFWFAENPGLALPLASLQNTDVYINITLRNLNDLYTVIDVNPASPTYGRRIKPTADTTYNALKLFLSPPLTTGLPSNPNLTNFFPDPWLEGNFIYLTEMEMNQLALADQTFLVKTVNYVNKEGQYGGNTDLELPMMGLVTRLVFSAQRGDKILQNDWDNYTNWENSDRPPFTPMASSNQLAFLTAGQEQITSVYPRDPMIDGVLLLDGKERFSTKPLPFFSLLQMYKHTTGNAPKLPGVYMYSFALDHDRYQPSGALNGSMFNKITLRLTLQQPLAQSVTADGEPTSTVVCVLKSTVFSPNPVVIPAADLLLRRPDGTLLYNPGDVVTVVQANDNITFTYTYNVGVYVESMNFLRIVSGLGNLVFAS